MKKRHHKHGHTYSQRIVSKLRNVVWLYLVASVSAVGLLSEQTHFIYHIVHIDMDYYSILDTIIETATRNLPRWLAGSFESPFPFRSVDMNSNIIVVLLLIVCGKSEKEKKKKKGWVVSKWKS